MEYFVSKTGNDDNDGSCKAPFHTIGRAAQIALPGDVVTVSAGTYRELVDPFNGGMSQNKRITYRGKTGDTVKIKGSEVISGWKKLGDGIYSVEVSNDVFGKFNPFKIEMKGDWLASPSDRITHLGTVYIDEVAMYEAANLMSLKNAKERTSVKDFFSGKEVPELFSSRTKYQWFSEVRKNTTIIYGNFHTLNPNDHITEITVRPTVFYPSKTNIDYITVENFDLSQAASTWAPPTGGQIGLIGPHWSKGWIIQNNNIHNSKTCGISLGIDSSISDNYSLFEKDKHGYQYQIEAVFKGLHSHGWSKNQIGSHVITENLIHDCGQAGIVGHMGGAFCQITNNEIYNIGLMREFYGWEMAGIKLHAPIDTIIEHNYIHDAVMGMWIDWEAQGTRISRNIIVRNEKGISIEVSHGPFIVDDNIIDAPFAAEIASQGGAFVNNLIRGSFEIQEVLDRSTPYHIPHSTAIKGFSVVHKGDMRFFNNIFVYGDDSDDRAQGTEEFDGYPQSMKEYIDLVQNRHTGVPHRIDFDSVKQPIFIKQNIYVGGVKGTKDEINAKELKDDISLKIFEKGRDLWISFNILDDIKSLKNQVLTTQNFEPTHISGAAFEDEEGKSISFDRDIIGHQLKERFPGPLGKLVKGKNLLKIWERNG